MPFQIDDKTILACVLGLAGVIAELWRRISKAQAATERKLDACEKHHARRDVEQDRLRTECRELAVRIAEIQGHQRGVESLALRVLEALKGEVNADGQHGQ